MNIRGDDAIFCLFITVQDRPLPAYIQTIVYTYTYAAKSF